MPKLSHRHRKNTGLSFSIQGAKRRSNQENKSTEWIQPQAKARLEAGEAILDVTVVFCGWKRLRTLLAERTCINCLESTRKQQAILHVQACIGRWMWQLLSMNPLFCGKRCADKSSGNTLVFYAATMQMDRFRSNQLRYLISLGCHGGLFLIFGTSVSNLGLFWNFQPSNDRFEKSKQQLCTTTGEPTMTSASRKSLPWWFRPVKHGG